MCHIAICVCLNGINVLPYTIKGNLYNIIMVRVCEFEYPKDREIDYKQYYESYPYELHDFQKWAVEAIVTGNHVLICCPTGSGKTFGGEFALNYFHSKKKKTIYTTPIKALSNEKFYNFTQKYPHISVGLITGDIKTNPDADVLIMTTEILMNKLYQINSSTPIAKTSVSFDMDIQNELGCVVFDEIHFIGDESRGMAWEQSIMMLPKHVQMVGLSATLDSPETFAKWLETKGDVGEIVDKEVYLARKQVRAVPLIHYSFITVPPSVNKIVRDKSLQEEIKKIINKPLIIQDSKGNFNDLTFQNVTKTLRIFEKNEIRIKRQFVLNQVADYLTQNEMLPALCYVFSRKQLEICAEEMTANLLEFDSKVPYIVDRECEQIIRKLPNYEEYLHLPEYVNTVKLLRKGVGIHHAGLMPILREMTELLFSRGFIKILFATETMAIGINLPVKTTIFTDINKFNGETMRMLYGHEYNQASGRAGRLGLDNVGHVIHLNNLFRNVDSINYKIMMNGKPQKLTSKFKISYNLLLNLLDIGDTNLVKFVNRSMVTDNLDSELSRLSININECESELTRLKECSSVIKTPFETIKEFLDLQKVRQTAVNKKRKDIERQLDKIQETHKNIDKDKELFLKIKTKEDILENLVLQKDYITKYVSCGVDSVIRLLRSEGFINEEPEMTLTLNGKIATQLRETHCIIFTKMIVDRSLSNLSTNQVVSLFSCFTNISVQEDLRDICPKTEDEFLHKIVINISDLYDSFKHREFTENINTGFDYNIQYDLLNYSYQWCECNSVEDCKYLLQKMADEKQIFLGEFVKAILKINNISCEIEKICELIGDMEFLSKLRQVSVVTMKYVVTNQSLYV